MASLLAVRTASTSLIALATMCALGGCKASVNAKAEASTDKKAEADFDSDVAWGKNNEDVKGADTPADPAEGGDTGGFSDGQAEDTALLGARPDLVLATNPAPTCQCLAVVLGAPSNEAFGWQSVVPRIDSSRQLVVAFTSDGVSCEGAAGESLGASYWGFKRDGGDVIIVVEEGRPGRPITRGAIIPKPVAGGHVYVQPSRRSVPYGRGPKGEARCQVL